VVESTDGALFVVATPIGNLEDMTARAVRTLKEVDVIAAEDTRVTGKLLAHYGIDTQMLRHEAHNEASSTQGLLKLLMRGQQIALVSDAGTPAVSDPGARLVEAARNAGFPVYPIPGPSALTALVSAAGNLAYPVTFYGFLTKKASERQSVLTRLGPGSHVFFCPARDLGRVVEDIASLRPEVTVVIGRELTKHHESWYRGKAAELIDAFSEATSRKGESVLAISVDGRVEAVSDSEIAAELEPLLKEGVRKKGAARIVGRWLGVSTQRAYQLAVDSEGDTK
jgi:16S rRNA (cytidine1402-2'-O)-methyltransferase